MLNCSIESACAGQFQYIGVYMAIHDSVYSDTKIQIHRPNSIESGIIFHVISPIGKLIGYVLIGYGLHKQNTSIASSSILYSATCNQPISCILLVQ